MIYICINCCDDEKCSLDMHVYAIFMPIYAYSCENSEGKSRVDSGSKFREFLGKIGKVFWPNIFYTCSSISVEATIKIS